MLDMNVMKGLSSFHHGRYLMFAFPSFKVINGLVAVAISLAAQALTIATSVGTPFTTRLIRKSLSLDICFASRSLLFHRARCDYC